MWNALWNALCWVLEFCCEWCCVIVVLAILAGFGGCGVWAVKNEIQGRPVPDWQVVKETRIDAVERVLMNQADSYTLFVRDGAELVAVSLGSDDRTHVRVYSDVPAGQPMWAKKTVYEDRTWNSYFGGSKTRQWAEVHIRGAQDVEGGEHTHTTGGKNPKTIHEKQHVVK